MNEELKTQLRRQITFLRNSSNLYDQGYEEEAARIAVVIRVLMHDARPDMPSLLNQAECKNKISLVSTAGNVPTHVYQQGDVFVFFPSGFDGSGPGYSRPGTVHTYSLTVEQWWSQPVFYAEKTLFTRQEIVLKTAHKDGGAHVVGEVNPAIEKLRTPWLEWVTTAADGTQVKGSMGNNHFAVLRHLANELLASDELIALTL